MYNVEPCISAAELAFFGIFFLKCVFFRDLSDGKKFFFKKSIKSGQKSSFLLNFLFFRITKMVKTAIFARFWLIFSKNFFYHLKDLEKTRILKKKFPKKVNSAAEI